MYCQRNNLYNFLSRYTVESIKIQTPVYMYIVLKRDSIMIKVCEYLPLVPYMSSSNKGRSTYNIFHFSVHT